MNPPSSFPNAICWDPASLLDVTNTVALSVSAEIFEATHFPSPIHRLNPTTTPPTTTAYSESELLASFLGKGHERLFCVAVGDSGTGKSHLIRWLWQQVEKKTGKSSHIVRIPRHAANLADVLRLLTKDFHGEVVKRIRREIELTIDLTLPGAVTRVLDELAFVLAPENREKSTLQIPDDEIHKDVILPLLPALLGDAAIRSHFRQVGEEGIVTRLAKHVMGRREERLETAPNLKWTANDLKIPIPVSLQAGNSAKELATWMLNDEHTRVCAANILNSALTDAWPALVGLQRGNLRGAMLEIRRELKSLNKELLLFLEDLSVSQGMDAELIEALIVKPSEQNNELCVIRSIVGVTRDDFRSMRENILSRIDLAVSFDIKMDQDGRGGLGETALADFASRYLNATRYPKAELEKWYHKKGDNDELPSFCEETHCPNRAECHRLFGHVSSRGLYPFNTHALSRLYRNLEGDERTAFNPRLLVRYVLREFLELASTQIPSKSFPGSNFRDIYHLHEVGVTLETQLNQKYGIQAVKIRTAIEIYSEQPSTGSLAPDLTEKFGLSFKKLSNLPPAPTPPPTNPSPVPPHPPTPQRDTFDIWCNEKTLNDRDLNKWRIAVYDAMCGARDWDSDPLGPFFMQCFKRAYIHFEGQHVNQSGDVSILIKPNAEVAVALRALVNGVHNNTEALFAAHFVENWNDDVCRKLQKLARTTGTPKPLNAAVHLLVLGALICGKIPENATRQKFLEAVFEKWPTTPPPLASNSVAWNQLHDAFQKWGPKVRDWLLAQIGGGKGGQVGSLMIDTAQILEIVDSAKRAVQVDFPPDFAQTWGAGLYEPIIELGKRVTQHLEPATENWLQYSKQWLTLLDSARGEYSVSDLGKALKGAFASGQTAAVFNNSRIVEYSIRCEQIASGGLDQTVQAVRAMISDQTRNQRLRLIAQLDPTTLEQVSETLKFSDTELRKANELLERKLADGPGAQLAALESEVQRKVSDLKEKLQTMVDDKAEE